MLARVSRGSSGLSEYLRTGRRADWIADRQEKDIVIPLYGDLDIFERTENYLYNNKNYKDNYTHITISFSENDMKKLESLPEDERNNLMSEMVKDYIKHHTSGYDIDEDVIAYAEAHYPKIKYNEKGDKRYLHIHIGIAHYNPLSDTQLRTTFANNTYIDNVLQTYINKKYDLTIPRHIKREPTEKTEIGLTRKELKKELAEIKDHGELMEWFRANNIQYREVVTKSNHYYKIINSKGKDINLRGKGFEHLQKLTIDKDFKFPEDRNLQDLENILGSYYEKRIAMIDKRRSKKSKKQIRDIYKDKYNDKENAIFMSFQQKVFYKHYKHIIDNKLKGYYVDTKNDKEVKFINKKKGIEVVDKGDKIVTNKSRDNLSERVALMIDVAEAKGWNLATVNINGSEAFQKEARRQIVERLHHKNLISTEAVASKIKERTEKQRPSNPVEYQVKQKQDQEAKQEAEKSIDVKLLKTALKVETVLAYAKERYGIDTADYEITDDNKINNKNNKQKPKNVIDFLQKEIGLTTKEAIAQCQELMRDQPLPVDAAERPPIKLKPTKRIDNARVHKPVNRADQRGSSQTRHDMRTVSSIDLLHNKIKRDRSVLSGNERNRLWSEADTDQRVQSTDNRVSETPIRERSGGLKMPLSVSICKEQGQAAVSNWERVQVKSYSELATLMQQHPYSTAVFKDGYRKGENVEGFNNLLIFDIDNDKYDKPLQLEEAKKLLEKHGISAMIMPSRSHNKPKKVASDHQKKHGKPVVEEYHTAERYRIMIPTNKAFKSTDLDHYREFMETAAKALSLSKYTDPKALRDRARFYYKSPIEAMPVPVQGDRVMQIDKIEQVAISRVEKRRAEKRAERERIEKIRAEIRQHRAAPSKQGQSEALSYANVEAIIDTPIMPIIQAMEQGEPYRDGSYQMVRTSNAKYSIIEDNVAHDFKSDKTYNPLTYLQEQLGTDNVNIIARELQKITGQEYLQVNTEAVKRAISKAQETATNDKSFEESIKQHFEVKFCQLGKESITIADQQISLGDIGIEKKDLIESFRANREEIKRQEEAEKARQEEANKQEAEQEEAQQQTQSPSRGMMR